MSIMQKKSYRVLWLASWLCFLIPQLSIAQPFVETAKLTSSESVSQDFLGGSARVDISGTYAIAGVPFKKDDPDENAGKAYIYERDSITDEWFEVAILTAPNRMPDDAFGVSVAISGNLAIIGASADNEDANEENPAESAGAAYIFKRSNNGDWNFMQKITASDRREFDRFGTGVDIYGSRIVVGATSNDFDADGENFRSGAGAAFIFELNDSGNWIEVAKIVASNRAILDQFGFPVVVTADQVFVCSPRKDDAGLEEVGNIYVFSADTSGTWIETQRIVSNQPFEKAQFGNSLSVYGNNAIVGEHKADTSYNGMDLMEDAGLAHILQLDSNNTWAYVQTIEPSDRREKDVFGSSVSISDDYAIVGAIRQDTDSNGENPRANAGAAYVFWKDHTGYWSQAQKVTASDRVSNAGFGSELSIDGDLIAIGSQLASAGEVMFAGAIYILKLCNTNSVIEASACDVYIAPSGMELDSSGTYLDVIPNASGCDSLILINLTILHSTGAELDVFDCESYTVPSGDTTFFENGIYFDVIPNAAGCDSLIAIAITIWVVDTSVTQSEIGDTLWANAMNAEYQWYECVTEEIIPGATDRAFAPQGAGFFAVIVTDMNGCVDTSSCYEYVTTGLHEAASFPTNITIFPNPSSGQLTIDLGQIYSEYTVSVKSTSGQVIALMKGGFSQEIKLDISNYASGVYFIEIDSGAYTETIRVIKQ